MSMNKDPRFVVALTDALDDARSEVRYRAVNSLVSFGEVARSAIPELQRLLDDKSMVVREAAKVAIVKISSAADKSFPE